MIAQPAGLAEMPYRMIGGHRFQVDLGLDHWLRYFVWSPDFAIAENAARFGHLAHLIRTQPVVGALVVHRCRTESGMHEGSVHFRTELTDAWAEESRRHPRWDVLGWVPLTLAPSLLSHCPCNDHGFIREGRWVRA